MIHYCWFIIELATASWIPSMLKLDKEILILLPGFIQGLLFMDALIFLMLYVHIWNCQQHIIIILLIKQRPKHFFYETIKRPKKTGFRSIILWLQTGIS